ncbi:MAG: GspMb/PilO family protein [Desulfurivibrionaceae bacterium]|nr:GspMb/PilO family protein [Desulfobulbales bacterium]MDT8336101.1 GspMb/PilO family protein [Desulfurivibrionaceae bacterium]
MNNLVYFFKRFQRRTLLVAIAVLLLVVYAGRWVDDVHDARRIELENRLNRLDQSRLVTAKAEIYEKRLQNLLALKEQVDHYFFSGEDDNKLSSAMQLKIQALVVKAGLQAESIRPVMQKTEGQDREEGRQVLGEVLIKTRLAGTMGQFMNFLAELYRSEEFFEIESISFSPYQNTGLKIFIELKGYYVLPGSVGGSGEAES